MQLVRLDQVLARAAGEVDAFVEPPRRGFEVGDDEAAVAAVARRLDPHDDLALDLPGLGGIGKSPKRRTFSASPETRPSAASSARSAILASSTWLPARPKT